MVESSDRSGSWVPVAAGVGCAAGFGVLAVLWFSRDMWGASLPAHLPGLFDYPSAYLGDSVLLPVAVTLLLAGARLLPPASRDRIITVAAGLIGAAALAGLQALWLVDDNPSCNWTLPSPHRFNIAGVWHAVYSVLVAALLTGAIAMLARRISFARAVGGEAKEKAYRLLSSWGATCSLSCLFCYIVLAAHDSVSGTFGSRSTLMGLGIAFIAFLVLTVLVLRQATAQFWPAALLGLLAATATIMVMMISWHADRTRILGAAQAILAAVGVALLTLVPRLQDSRAESGSAAAAYRSYRPTLGNSALVGVILAVLLPSLWTLGATHLASSHWTAVAACGLGYAVAIAAAAVAVIRKERLTWLRQAADVLLVFVMLGAIALVAITVPRWHQASDSAPLVSFVVAIAISRVFFPMLQIRMHAEIRDEQSSATDGRYGLRGTAKLSATATLAMLIIAALTAAVSLLAFTLAAAIDRKYIADAGALHNGWLLLAIGFGLALFIGLLAWIKARTGASGLALAAPGVVLLWPTALAIFGAHGVPPVTWTALVGGVLLALWSANTMLNNVGLLHGLPIDRLHLGTIMAISASAFFSGSFALSAALASGPSHVYTWFAGISTATAVLAVNGALGVAAGSLINRSSEGQTRHGLIHNLIQDATLIVLLYLIVLVIPVVTLLHLPLDLDYWERIAGTFAIVGPFLTYFLGPYQWQLNTNLGHLSREITTRAENPEETRNVINAETTLFGRNRALLQAARGEMEGPEQQRFLRVLNAHIRNQNTLANSIVFLSIVGLLVLTAGKTSAVFFYLRRESRLDPEPPASSPGTPSG